MPTDHDRLGDRIFARFYDRMGRSAERTWLGRLRASLLRGVHGRVLEIGAGTGANLPHYGRLQQLTLAEPSAAMVQRLRPRAAAVDTPTHIVTAPVESLPVEDGCVDTVVSTLVLCSVDDLEKALAEVRRVLKPGGNLAVLEHVRDEGWHARLQDGVEPLWRRIGAGCRPNRDTRDALQRAGFEVGKVHTITPIPKWAVVSPMITGTALAP